MGTCVALVRRTGDDHFGVVSTVWTGEQQHKSATSGESLWRSSREDSKVHGAGTSDKTSVKIQELHLPMSLMEKARIDGFQHRYPEF